MKSPRILICFLLLSVVIVSSFTAPKPTGNDILAKMYKRYAGKWYKTFTFTQATETFRNDSLLRKSTWYESIVFPYDFRITFGNPSEGNAMIQKKDSVYNFRDGKLFRRSPKGDDLTFLLGGMYFMTLDEVKTKMQKEGYDISKAHESEWKGKKVYVIGAETPNEKVDQLWIDKDKLVVVRFLKFDANGKEEAVFDDHKKYGRAWSETSCSFYRNDSLIQTEKYYDCKVNTIVDMKIFDQNNFVR